MTTDTNPTGDPGAPNIAQRLAQHPRWEWRDRMIAIDTGTGRRLAATAGGGLAIARSDAGGRVYAPDLADDATAGVLLGMVREWAATRHDHHVEASWRPSSKWRWYVGAGQPASRKAADGAGPTLGEAAAACLLACWALDGEATKPAPE